MQRAFEVRIGYLYPEWLNLYGDRGNVLVLQRRLEWRLIKSRVEQVPAQQQYNGNGPDPSDFSRFDLVLMGGGSDDAQRAIATDLSRYKASSLKAEVEHGLVVLAICGGYQQLGHYYRTALGEKLPGIGLLDVYTEASRERLVGNVAAHLAVGGAPDATLVGYENHSGRTHLGDKAAPLARVLHGYGNNGADGIEGAVYKNVFGTYLHGPLLPKNPIFADHLLQLALRRRYGDEAPELRPLDDRLELQAHAERLQPENRRTLRERVRWRHQRRR